MSNRQEIEKKNMLNDAADFLVSLTKDLYGYSKRYFWIFILFSALFAYKFVKEVMADKKDYKAEYKLCLNEEDNSIAQIASFAQSFGMSGGGSQFYTIDKIKEILKSRGTAYKSFMEPMQLEGVNDLAINHYIRLFVNKSKNPFFKKHPNYTYKNVKLESLDTLGVEFLNIAFEDVKKNIEFFVAKDESGICSFTYTSDNQYFSGEFLKSLINSTIGFFKQNEAKNTTQLLRTLGRQMDSIDVYLSQKELSLAKVTDSRIGIVKSDALLDVAKQSKEVGFLNQQLAKYKTQLEIAKGTSETKTEKIIIVDRPYYPLPYEKSNKIVLLIIHAVYIAIASTIMILFIEFIRVYFKKLKQSL